MGLEKQDMSGSGEKEPGERKSLEMREIKTARSLARWAFHLNPSRVDFGSTLEIITQIWLSTDPRS